MALTWRLHICRLRLAVSFVSGHAGGSRVIFIPPILFGIELLDTVGTVGPDVSLAEEVFSRVFEFARGRILSVSPLWLAVVLGTVLRVLSKLVRRRVRRRAQCGALATRAEALLVTVQFILLYLVPLTVIFMALRLAVGHYLPDKLFDLVSFNLLRGQVLAVLAVDLVHSANGLILQRFFE